MRESSIRRPQPSRTLNGGALTTRSCTVTTAARIEYQPTAYVANQILVSASGRGADLIRDLTTELNASCGRSRTSRTDGSSSDCLIRPIRT